MTDITIDTAALTDPLFVIPELSEQTVDGTTGATLPLPDGVYHVRHSTVDPGGFAFSVTGGSLSFDPSSDAVAQGRGGTTLTLTGVAVTVDATHLNDSLLLSTFSDVPIPRDQTQPLRLLPSAQYLLIGGLAGADIGLTLDPRGGIELRPQDAPLATTAAGSLTITGYRITIDGTALDHDLYPLGFDNRGQALSRSSTHTLALLPAVGYGFQPGSGIVADFAYALTAQGTVTVDPSYAGFAHADGLTLTIAGYRMAIDGTALDHDLYPVGNGAGQVLPRGSVNFLTVIPAAGYGFQPGSGIVADFAYALTAQGTVTVDPSYAGFAHADGLTLLIQGYRVVLDATDADSDLVGIVQVPYPPQTPRTLEMTLIPCAGYVPRTTNGIFTVPPAATSYVAQQGTTPNPSQVNQEVSLRVSLQTDGAGEPPPAGLITFTVSGRLIASTPVEPDGTAELTTTFDAPGSIEIVVGYTGDEHRLSSNLIVAHLVQ
jgi:Bacterial Ig-like domain (group 3)